jgi:MGT family glycosyltransferase
MLCSDALSPLWRSFGRSVPQFAGIYSGLAVAICPASLDPAGPPAGRVIHLRPAAPPVQPCRASTPPLVYVTFGTMWGDIELIGEVLHGIASLPIDVVVTLGRLDRELVGEVPPNVRIEQYVPQAELLPHCSAVVHHGGAGTMFGALAHGLPSVVLPQAADNYLNAEMVERAGVGRVVRRGEPTSTAVQHAVAAVLDEPSYAAAARRVAEEISSMPAPSQARDRIREFAGISEHA